METLTTHSKRQYIPATGTRCKLRTWSDYVKIVGNCNWQWFTVREVRMETECATLEHYNAGNTGEMYSVPLNMIEPPIGWQSRYTIYCEPDKAHTVVTDWFSRGIVVRQSHDMSGSMPTAFQPLTDNVTPQSPHWQFPEATDVIPTSQCAAVFSVVAVEREEITSATIGYPADPNCKHCGGKGRRTVGELATVRNEPVSVTRELIDKGTIPVDDFQHMVDVATPNDSFRCHCHYGAVSHMGRSKRAKLFKTMIADGWTIRHVRYGGGYWERIRETIVHKAN